MGKARSSKGSARPAARQALAQEAARRSAEAEALAEAARIVDAGTAAGTTLRSILEAALRVVPARVAFLLLPRDGGTTLEIAAIAGAQEQRRLRRLEMGEGVTGRAFRTAAVQVVGDARADPDYVEGADGIRSELAVPIVSGGTVIGVLNLEDDEPARFGRREARLVEAFAAHAAAALATDRLLAEASSRAAELEARARQQAAVADLGQRGLAVADLSALMEHAVARVAETLGVEYAKVLEALPGGGELLLRAGVGWKDGLVGSATVSAGRASQAGYTLLAQEPVIVEDLATETRFAGPALLREHAVASGVSVVIQGDDGPYGVLGAHTTRRRAFTRDDIHFLQAVANVLSAAIGRTRAEDRLRLLRSAVENANDAIVITDADLDQGVHVLYANPAFTRATGYTLDEVVGRSPRMVQGPWTDPAVRARLRLALERGEPFRRENVNRRKDGTEYDVEVHIAPIRAADGRITHYVSIQRDVTERKRAEHELARLALYDSLTGLPNRSLFGDRLGIGLAGAGRVGSSLALLLLDLDGFKEVNDTLGHQAGDELLQQIGPRLRGELRAVDTVARLGGDEFAVLLPGATKASAAKLAQKLLAALERPFDVAGQAVALGGSIGVAAYPEHGDSADLLLRCADVAMYAAKGSGGACAVYASDLDPHTPGRLAVIADLRRAIGDGGLELHYQPIVTIATGQTATVEALARWPHAKRGRLLPEEFIPIAERSGLIRPLTEWVLGEALRQQTAWRAAGVDLCVAVNVSMRNLVDPEFPATVERLLAERAATPAPLRLEITESVIMADPERALAILARLRGKGLRADIDDFGTGYSSLAYLQRLPVDAVKIDRSFVGRMTSDDGSAAIVRATIELCHSLGLAVVAEGVEDRATWERLAAMGCDEAQGYYLSAAVAAPQLERWLAERPPPMTGREHAGDGRDRRPR